MSSPDDLTEEDLARERRRRRHADEDEQQRAFSAARLSRHIDVTADGLPLEDDSDDEARPPPNTRVREGSVPPPGRRRRRSPSPLTARTNTGSTSPGRSDSEYDESSSRRRSPSPSRSRSRSPDSVAEEEVGFFDKLKEKFSRLFKNHPLLAVLLGILFLAGVAALIYAMANPAGIIALLGISLSETAFKAISFVCWLIYNALMAGAMAIAENEWKKNLKEAIKGPTEEIARDVATGVVAAALRDAHKKDPPSPRSQFHQRINQHDADYVLRQRLQEEHQKREEKKFETSRCFSAVAIGSSRGVIERLHDSNLSQQEIEEAKRAVEIKDNIIKLVEECNELLIAMQMCLAEDASAIRIQTCRAKFTDITVRDMVPRHPFLATGKEICDANIYSSMRHKSLEELTELRLRKMPGLESYSSYIARRTADLGADQAMLTERREIFKQQLFYIVRQDYKKNSNRFLKDQRYSAQCEYRQLLRVQIASERNVAMVREGLLMRTSSISSSTPGTLTPSIGISRAKSV